MKITEIHPDMQALCEKYRAAFPDDDRLEKAIEMGHEGAKLAEDVLFDAGDAVVKVDRKVVELYWIAADCANAVHLILAQAKPRRIKQALKWAFDPNPLGYGGAANTPN